MGLPSAARDWEYLEAEVTERIRALAAVDDSSDEPDEVKRKIYNDLIYPNVRLLAEFCTSVTLGDADDDSLDGAGKDITGCDV